MRRMTIGAAALIAVAASVLTLSVPAVAGAARALFATDAGKVDGYNAAELVRVAGGTRDGATPLVGDGTIVTAEIRVPEPGYVAITATSDASNEDTLLTPGCVLAVDGLTVEHSARRVDHYYTAEADCQTGAFGSIEPGHHVVSLEAFGADAATEWGASSVTIVFSPFGPRGARPSAAAPLVDAAAPTLEGFLARTPLDATVTKATLAADGR